MQAVDIDTALAYGVELFKYVLAIWVVGGLLLYVGRGGDLESIFALAGWVVLTVGHFAILFKIVADGVATAMEAVEQGEPVGPTTLGVSHVASVDTDSGSASQTVETEPSERSTVPVSDAKQGADTDEEAGRDADENGEGATHGGRDAGTADGSNEGDSDEDDDRDRP